ncbi:MAG: radical SAM protein [Elusimicrobia bacterium]|nr:radical SAM protein [Elusimicrobiota bacterium]
MPDIPVWPRCNINCIFCSNPVYGFRETEDRYVFARFAKDWQRHLDGKYPYLKFSRNEDFIGLTGGEPAMHPDFFKIIALLRKTRPDAKIMLLTNARMFKYKDFAQKCLLLGGDNLEIKVPLFGYNSKTHEAISRTPGSFADSVEGIKNIFLFKSPRQKIHARIILHKIQMLWLKKLLEFIAEKFPLMYDIEILFVEYEGFAEQNIKALKIPITQCAKELGKLYPVLKKFNNFKLLHFPLCVIPKKLWPYAWLTLDPIKLVHSVKCGKCAMLNYCVGIHKSYAIHAGVAEYKPVKKSVKFILSGDKYNPILKTATTGNHRRRPRNP